MSSSLSENLKLAKLAAEYTKLMLRHGAANKKADLLLSVFANRRRLSDMRAEKRKFTGMGGQPANTPAELKLLPQIRLIAQFAKKAKVGNCGEHACVALTYLRDMHRVKRLDYMQYGKGGDHAWVVIGRAEGSVTGDYKTWGANAVVCDAWDDAVFPGSQVPGKLYGYGKVGYHSVLVTT